MQGMLGLERMFDYLLSHDVNEDPSKMERNLEIIRLLSFNQTGLPPHLDVVLDELKISDDTISFLDSITTKYNFSISLKALKKVSEIKNFDSIKRFIVMMDFGQFIKSHFFDSLLELEIDDDIITFLEIYLFENNCKITFETLLCISQIENFKSIIGLYNDMQDTKNKGVQNGENMHDFNIDFNFCDIEFLKKLSAKLKIGKVLYGNEKLSNEQFKAINGIEIDGDIVTFLEVFSSENDCKISQEVLNYISEIDNFKSFIKFYNYFKLIESRFNSVDYNDKGHDHLSSIKKINESCETNFVKEFKLNDVKFLIELSDELKNWNNDMFEPIYVCKLYKYIYEKKYENPDYTILYLCRRFNDEFINHSTDNSAKWDSNGDTCTKNRVHAALYNLGLNLDDLLAKYECNQLDVEKVFYYLNILGLPRSVLNNEDSFKHILSKANNYSVDFLKSFYDDLLDQFGNLSELLKTYDLLDIAKIFYFCNITDTDINEILFNEENSNYILSEANNYDIDFLKFFYNDLFKQSDNLSKLLERYSLSDIAKIFYFSKIYDLPINVVAEEGFFVGEISCLDLEYLKKRYALLM